MNKYIISVLNKARELNNDHYRLNNSGSFINILHSVDRDYSSDRRYKIHILACSISGDMNINTAIIKYMNKKYYVAYDNKLNSYITE